MNKAVLAALIGILAVATLLFAPLRGAEKKPPETYVVIVGISNYADKQIKPRLRAEDDARAWYDLFTNKDYMGADAEHMRLLLGEPDGKRDSQKATHENIIKGLHWLAANARRDDLAIFVFLGQGGSLGETGDRVCYFASDSTLKGRAKDAVAAAEIGQELDKLKSQRFCAFVDVNFKGYDPGKDPIPEPTLDKAPYKEFLAPEDGEEHATAPGRILFLATNGLSQSLDLKEHGLFTHVLLDGLKGAADKEGYEPDGAVTADELAVYLEKQLPELARQHGQNDTEKGQRPFVLGTRPDHFQLTQNPAVMPKVKERLEKLAELVKDKKISDTLAEEGKKLLSQMPRFESQRSLRKAYQQLVDGTLTAEKFEKQRATILDAMKLKASEAADYAAKVVKCTQLIRDEYVKPINQGELVAWAVQGLYRYADEKLSKELTDAWPR